jgi:hypothetical protein
MALSIFAIDGPDGNMKQLLGKFDSLTVECGQRLENSTLWN